MDGNGQAKFDAEINKIFKAMDEINGAFDQITKDMKTVRTDIRMARSNAESAAMSFFPGALLMALLIVAAAIGTAAWVLA